MSKRRRFLKTLLCSSLAILIWPFSRTRAGEGTIQEKSVDTPVDSAGVQGVDSTSTVPADSTTTEASTGEKVTIPLSKIKSLGSVGGSARLKIKDRAFLLVRDSKDAIRAFSPSCTHQKTTLKYNHKKRRMECPSHGSLFDLQGSVLKGPASKPLPTYEAVLTEGRIILNLEEE